jgi:hypothetical protein
MSSDLDVLGARTRLGRRILGVFAAMSLLLGGTALTAAVRADAPTLPINPRTHLLPGEMPLTSAVNTASAPAGSHLNYYGGHVISNVHVTQVLYGTGTFTPEVSGTGANTLAAFYRGVTNSPYFDWLTEYNTTINAANGQPGTNQVIGRGTFVGQTRITPALTNNLATIDDSKSPPATCRGRTRTHSSPSTSRRTRRSGKEPGPPARFSAPTTAPWPPRARSPSSITRCCRTSRPAVWPRAAAPARSTRTSRRFRPTS